MPTLTLITWLDPFELAASLPPRMGLFKPAETEGVRVLPVRSQGEGGKWVGHASTQKWVELANMRSRLKRLGDALLGEVEFGLIFLEMLDPGAVVPWQPCPGEPEWSRLHLVLRTNPGAALLSAEPDGVQTASPAPGQVVGVNGRWWLSAVNLGSAPRVHLVVDLRRKVMEKP